jgi:insertion element IS1 protein InsB
MIVRDTCPACGSPRYKKNGHTRHGKQNHQCKACGRQFAADAVDRTIAQEQRQRIAQLLGERLSLRGICRTMGVSLTWLFHFMVECFAACPDHLHAQSPTHPREVLISRLEAEADEMWSFVQKKANKQWIWIAMDATSRQIIAFHIERFNNTLRQRVSRLVRETLSFSKKLAHHIGAIKYFICNYNLEKAGALPL